MSASRTAGWAVDLRCPDRWVTNEVPEGRGYSFSDQLAFALACLAGIYCDNPLFRRADPFGVSYCSCPSRWSTLSAQCPSITLLQNHPAGDGTSSRAVPDRDGDIWLATLWPKKTEAAVQPSAAGGREYEYLSHNSTDNAISPRRKPTRRSPSRRKSSTTCTAKQWK